MKMLLPGFFITRVKRCNILELMRHRYRVLVDLFGKKIVKDVTLAIAANRLANIII